VTTTAPRPGTGRDDWLDEGLRLVASLGAPALTLDRICERMALTEGAFYHLTLAGIVARTALAEPATSGSASSS
jgi:hypothetical protein